MKRLLIIIGLILLGTQALWATITVDGHAYLENQTSHDSIKVLFERTAPSSLTDSTYTNSTGYYSIDIETGFYDISYSKDEYFTEYLNEQTLYSNTTIPDITLMEHTTILNVPSIFSTIQSAINCAYENDTVLVDTGTYVENVNFIGKNITVASLFFTTQDTSYISQTIIDGNQDGSVIEFSSGENSTAILSGFTIQNGNAGDGGGIFCSSSSPSLQNVTISGNSANNYESGGGGIFCDDNSNPSLQNVTIIGNSANDYGGGIYCDNYSNPIVTNVDIIGNEARVGGGVALLNSNPTFIDVLVEGNIAIANSAADANGGGIYCNNSSSPILTNIIVLNNISIHSADGTANGGGIAGGTPLLTDCIIENNTAVNGSGGGFSYCSPTMIGGVITGNTAANNGGGIYGGLPNLTMVVINNNQANKGGGIYCYYLDPILENVTIANNSANNAGGGIYCGNSSPSLVNTIVSDNTGNYGIYVESGNPTIEYSDFYNNQNGNFYNCGYVGVNVTTNANGDSCDAYFNIQGDPLFVEPDSSNYHLTANSPCIDVGDPDSPLDPDGTVADMGAFYFEQVFNVEPTELEFGNVFIGDDSTLSITLKNYSDSVITIYNVLCSDTVFTTNWTEPTIPAGDSLVIDVTFTPHTTGNKTGTLTIDNSYINKNVSLSGNGLGAYILPDLYSLNFGAIEPGYPDTLLLEITNDGNINLTIQNIIDAPTNYFNFISITDSTILPDNSSILHIEFDPQVEGLFSDTLFIVSNAYNEGTLAINLSGEGGLTPAPVENLTINVDSVNASLNWDEVTTTIHGNPLVVDCYLVYYCGTPDSVYYFLGYTTDLYYTHNGVSFFDNQMFYQVTAYVGDMPTLLKILAKYPDIKLGELDRLVESKTNYFRIMK